MTPCCEVTIDNIDKTEPVCPTDRGTITVDATCDGCDVVNSITVTEASSCNGVNFNWIYKENGMMDGKVSYVANAEFSSYQLQWNSGAVQWEITNENAGSFAAFFQLF